MQVAEIVSDLTSLQVCDPSAALALVSARPEGHESTQKPRNGKDEDSDPDLKRAKDLLDLHANVKVAHLNGKDNDLNEAREAVEKVLRTL